MALFANTLIYSQYRRMVTEMASVSKQFLKEFIEAIRNQPAVWQIKSDNYRNKTEKNKAWQNLVLKYREVDKEATIEVVKKKFNCLRTAYRRELQKIRKSEKSGAGGDDIHVPSLWYFHQMDFLRDQELQMESTFTTFDDSVEIENPRNSKKRKFNESDFLKKAVDYLGKTDSQPQRDEAEIFGEAWAVSFRKLNEDQKIYAKRLMDETLVHAQLGQLSYDSCLHVGILEDGRSTHIQRSISSNLISHSRSPSPLSDEMKLYATPQLSPGTIIS